MEGCAWALVEGRVDIWMVGSQRNRNKTEMANINKTNLAVNAESCEAKQID